MNQSGVGEGQRSGQESMVLGGERKSEARRQQSINASHHHIKISEPQANQSE